MVTNRECRINTNFISSIDVFSQSFEMYKRKNYEKALCLLEKSLQSIEIPSFCILSEYYDLAASILWKIGESEKSYALWQKSLSFDNYNRHSYLSLSLLYKQQTDFCQLFIQIKLNEYYSLREYCENAGAFSQQEQEKVVDYLLFFWNKNLTNKNYTEMDELELVDYFIGLKVF
ncbi:MAG: hypothetical protein A2086_13405 [Spirochaetes bacterium GWD1_27_9]|nr:MAG: hypothetical protein A2Z98_02120 [Spirochaetes bacterium GWB1_27_13]OHD23091.1 MAG: hypothetical protein A2Y34_16890 [Spirochaetes bacterium GWC1_27_15]OHD39903.1 MAG: hypothetical protein A2086_13405 [Spirochaetes bacterium GWD1_27_9]